MILVLGATSYIGQAFTRELRSRGESFIPLARNTLDYTRFDLLFQYVRSIKPDFIINAGSGMDDWEGADSEHARTHLFQENTLLPQTIGRVCMMTNIPWGHVSSSCIFKGAKVLQNGGIRTEVDLNNPRVRHLFARHPENFLGFNELDEPNSCFRAPPCSYGAGTIALAEEWLAHRDNVYVWRAGTPLDDRSEESNLLFKLLRVNKVFDQIIAVSHVHDFVRACLQLVERHAPFGTYNVTNPGALAIREITTLMEQTLKPAPHFNFWESDASFFLSSMQSAHSSCILDSSKVLRLGIKLRSSRAAVESTLESWQRPGPGAEIRRLSAKAGVAAVHLHKSRNDV